MRRKSWIQTRHGRRADVPVPQAAQLHLDDMIWAGSQICRFGGHTRRFYGVMEHSLWVEWLVTRWIRAGYFPASEPDTPAKCIPRLGTRKARCVQTTALLHDIVTETYIGDIATPLAVTLGFYWADRDDVSARYILTKSQIEARIWERAQEQFVSQGIHLAPQVRGDPVLAWEIVRRADLQLLQWERLCLHLPEPVDWGLPGVTIEPVPLVFRALVGRFPPCVIRALAHRRLEELREIP